MSIASELSALNGYILGAYDEINDKGGTVPANKNMANLASAIASIPSGGGEVDISITDGESWWLYNSGLEVGPNQSISGRLIPIADITSSADSSVHYSLKELFDLIESGKDVIINGVPLNYSGDGTSGGAALLAPAHNTGKLHMNSRVEGEREVGPSEIATVVTWSGITLSSGLPLGYGIERQTYNGVSTYAFYAQGTETNGPLN